LRRLAMDALVQRRYTEAVDHLDRLLSSNADDHVALAMMGEVNLVQKNLLESIVYYTRAINAHPPARGYKERFLELASNSVVSTSRRKFKAGGVAFLRPQGLDCRRITRFWPILLFREPGFHNSFVPASRQRFAPANAAFFESLTDFSALASPLFL